MITKIESFAILSENTTIDGEKKVTKRETTTAKRENRTTSRITTSKTKHCF